MAPHTHMHWSFCNSRSPDSICMSVQYNECEDAWCFISVFEIFCVFNHVICTKIQTHIRTICRCDCRLITQMHSKRFVINNMEICATEWVRQRNTSSERLSYFINIYKFHLCWIVFFLVCYCCCCLFWILNATWRKHSVARNCQTVPIWDYYSLERTHLNVRKQMIRGADDNDGHLFYEFVVEWVNIFVHQNWRSGRRNDDHTSTSTSFFRTIFNFKIKSTQRCRKFFIPLYWRVK